ncbi:MAG: Ser-Thr-rich GPI-anchored membrane family protein [Patescibacteria group bacterium]
MKKTLIASIAVLVFVLLAIPFAQAQESQILLISTHADATVKAGVSQDILWTTENFPKEGRVDINLIQKVSDSPAEYKLIRSLHTGIENTGSATWTPSKTEAGENFLIEVGCSSTSEYPNGCFSGTDTETFAVKGGFSANLAAAFDGFISFIKGIFSSN